MWLAGHSLLDLTVIAQVNLSSAQEVCGQAHLDCGASFPLVIINMVTQQPIIQLRGRLPSVLLLTGWSLSPLVISQLGKLAQRSNM